MAQNIEEAKQIVKDLLSETGANPQTLVQFGNLAEACLKDKNLYPMFREQLIANDVLDESEVPTDFDYMTVATFSAMGKLISKMSQAGELGA